MARPKGYRLSRPAFEDMRQVKHLSLSEVAQEAGLGLTNLSGLLAFDPERKKGHRASLATVRALCGALGVAPETLFPELLLEQWGTPRDVAA